MQPDAGDFFREVTLRICSSLDIEQALTSTFDYLGQVIPADAMFLNYVDVGRRTMFPVAKVAQEAFVSFWEDATRETPLDEDFLRFFREKEKEGGAVTLINNPQSVPGPVLRCFPEIAAFSSLALNLSIRGQPVGSLAVVAKGHDRYTHEQAAMLELVRDPIALAMSNARRFMELERMRDLLAEDNRSLSADIERISGTEVIGADFGLQEVMEMIRRVANTNSPVLLLGETGTGKEVIANSIHAASPRRRGPMIRMQCGAVPESLIDSELFGHEKGAFTGASERKRGRFERADGGTLFLDEIGELSADAQVRLLRVLQEKQFERVGGTRTITVDVRVIAATHRNLEKMVREGQFREDLWYRLNVVPVRIPPLRLRRDDIPSLVHHFLQRKAREMNLDTVPEVDRNTMQRLTEYEWPGNVRELQNVVERGLILSTGSRLAVPKLRAVSREDRPVRVTPKPVTDVVRSMDEAMADHIRLVLNHCGGQVGGSGGAAEILGMKESTLRFRMKKLGIELSRFRRTVR